MGFSSKFNLTVMYPSVVSAMSSPGLMTLVSCVVSNVQVCGGGLWKNCALSLMQNGAYGQPFLLQEGGMGNGESRLPRIKSHFWIGGHIADGSIKSVPGLL